MTTFLNKTLRISEGDGDGMVGGGEGGRGRKVAGGFP